MPNFASLQEILALGHDLLLPLVTGCLIVGIVSYFITYFITLKVYAFVKMEKEKLIHHKEENKEE